MRIKLCVKSLKEGRNRGFVLSLITFFINSLLACRVSELIFKIR